MMVPAFLNGWFPPPGVPLYFWWDLVAVAPLILSLIIAFPIWLCMRKVSEGSGRFAFMALIVLDAILSAAAAVLAVIFFMFYPPGGYDCLKQWSTIGLNEMLTCDLLVLVSVGAFAVIKAIFIPIFLFHKFSPKVISSACYKFFLTTFYGLHIVLFLAVGGALAYVIATIPGMRVLLLPHERKVVLQLIDVIIMSFPIFKKHNEVDDVFTEDVGAW